MTLKKLQQLKICNAITVSFIFVLLSIGTISCIADENYAEKITKPKINISEVIKDADKKFAICEKDVKSCDEKILEDARNNYYLATTIDKGSIYPVIQLARIYDIQKKDRYAKSYFSRALAIDYKNTNANYYFGNYFYTRKNYRKALKLYRHAFKYGMQETPENLGKMADIYEKLGDLARANTYYKKLFLTNPNDSDTPDKIRELEDIKYQNTGYYKRTK
jgi:tetratricopeptide (TPR) repeat protein